MTRTPGKSNDFVLWIKKVLAAHPTATSDGGNSYFVGTKVVAEWRGTEKKSFIAPVKK